MSYCHHHRNTGIIMQATTESLHSSKSAAVAPCTLLSMGVDICCKNAEVVARISLAFRRIDLESLDKKNQNKSLVFETPGTAHLHAHLSRYESYPKLDSNCS